MFDYRRFALWLVVLLVPGGVLLLPVLLADMRRRRAVKPNTPNPETPDTPGDHPLPRLAA